MNHERIRETRTLTFEVLGRYGRDPSPNGSDPLTISFAETGSRRQIEITVRYQSGSEAITVFADRGTFLEMMRRVATLEVLE